MVDRPSRGPRASPIGNPGLERAKVKLVERDATNPGQQTPQSANVVTDAALVLVLKHKLRRGLLESSRRPDAVDLRLPSVLHHARELPFRFFELTCASALANSPPEHDLVDVPDAGPHDEAGYSFASHVVSP